MGNACAKCLGPQAPPVVFTICPVDGKAHQFSNATGTKIEATDTCQKCRKQRQQIDMECQDCQDGRHAWIVDLEPMSSAPYAQTQPVQVASSKLTDPTSGPPPGVPGSPTVAVAQPVGQPVAQGTPVQAMVVHKCTRCGLRQRPGPDGVYRARPPRFKLVCNQISLG